MRTAGRMRSTQRRRAFAVAVAVVALAALVSARAAASDGLEYRVKAEFVERFTHFVEWPATAFASSDAPFVICVVGDSPVTAYLDAMARDRRIKGRRVELRHAASAGELKRCQVLFIGAGERAHLGQILSSVAGLPVLTVADTDGFGRAGVLINLVVDEQGQVEFDISSRVARLTTLTLNAQLLKLSRRTPENN